MPLFNNTNSGSTVYSAAGYTLLPPNLGGPSLLRDWTTYQTLDHLVGPAIEFTRGSTATFTGSNGLIQSAATNAPRFDYDPVTLACRGLLIEEQRTNLFLQSEDFGTTWGATAGMTRTPNAGISPDGTNDAWSIIPAASLGFWRLNQHTSVVPGTTYTMSVYAKANGYNFIRFESSYASGGVVAYFNLSNGSVSSVQGNATASITNVGNGWYRCSAAFIATSTGGAPSYFYPAPTGSAQNYTGDGTSGVLLWGAQLEAGSFPTSYIPTTTATVTRSADVAQITGSNFTSFYNQSAGTLFANATPISNANNIIAPLCITTNPASSNNFVQIRGTSFVWGANYRKTSVSSGDIYTSIATASGVSRKVATSFDFVGGSRSVCASGGSVVTGTETNLFLNTMATLGVGYGQGGGNYLNGWLSSIAYYPSRLTDAQLQALTA